MEEQVIAYLAKYDVSADYGFLQSDSLTSLPSYFHPWLAIGTNLERLIKSRQLRSVVHQMPLLDHSRLCGHRELRLAHLVLGAIGAGYVWQDGDDNVERVIPRALAVPWCAVSQHLGLPIVLTHSDVALANWTKIDPNGSCEISNLRCIQLLCGGESCEWFFLVTVLVELDVARGLKHIVAALLTAEQGAGAAVVSQLVLLANVLRQATKTLGRMHERLSGDVFYNTIRPFLNGWTSARFNGGLIYEGVHTEPIMYSGDTAAQSTGPQCFDTILGIKHTGNEGEFLVKMRSYMLPAHRALIEDLEARESLRTYVERHAENEALVDVYNSCLVALHDFRSYHLQLVTKYVVVQANRHVNQYGGIKDKGTGGQNLLPFLKAVRSAAKQAMVDTSSTEPGSHDGQQPVDERCGLVLRRSRSLSTS